MAVGAKLSSQRFALLHKTVSLVWPQCSVLPASQCVSQRTRHDLTVQQVTGGGGGHLMNHGTRGICGLFANVAESGLLWPHCGSFNRILLGACSLRGRMGWLNEMESAQQALKGSSRVAASVIRGQTHQHSEHGAARSSEQRPATVHGAETHCTLVDSILGFLTVAVGSHDLTLTAV